MNQDLLMLLMLLGAVAAWAWAWLAIADRWMAAGGRRWLAHGMGALLGLMAGAGALVLGGACLMPGPAHPGLAAAGALLLGACGGALLLHDRKAAANGRPAPALRPALPRPEAAIRAWRRRKKARQKRMERKRKPEKPRHSPCALPAPAWPAPCKTVASQGLLPWKPLAAPLRAICQSGGAAIHTWRRQRPARQAALGMPFSRFLELRLDEHRQAWLLALPWLCGGGLWLLMDGPANDWPIALALLLICLLACGVIAFPALMLCALLRLPYLLLMALATPPALLSVFMASRLRILLRLPYVEEPWTPAVCSGGREEPSSRCAWSGWCGWLLLAGLAWWVGHREKDG